jgi:hypothetical protein
MVTRIPASDPGIFFTKVVGLNAASRRFDNSTGSMESKPDDLISTTELSRIDREKVYSLK